MSKHFWLISKDGQSSTRMKVANGKLVTVLVFILIGLSILRLLRLAIKTTPTASPPSIPAPMPMFSGESTSSRHEASAFTEKEFRFLSNIVSRKAPCNLLIFGLHQQSLSLWPINAGGITLILEDNPEKIKAFGTSFNSTRRRICKVKHRIPAREAYEVLKQARKDPACSLGSGPLNTSRCHLALTGLPREVLELRWDVVVVDGPSRSGPDAPGRMAAIYTARMVARSSDTTHVLVHDVNRMIEKWFSWEFLCEDNLVSSKGRFWDFEIKGGSNSRSFCPSHFNHWIGSQD